MLDLCFYIYTVEKHRDKMEKTDHEKAKVKHTYKNIYKNVYIKPGMIFIYIM